MPNTEETDGRRDKPRPDMVLYQEDGSRTSEDENGSERRFFSMNPNITKRNELLAQKVIKGLQSRNMSGYYAADKAEALQKAT